MKKESIDYWFSHIIGTTDNKQHIAGALVQELPLFISWIGERTCNLQCSHCIFQKEESYGENKEVPSILANLASQIALHHQPILIHEGRVLRKWHLPVFKQLQDQGVTVGLIDNGTYLHLAKYFDQKIDWIDISIDGTESIHNKQRNNDRAYAAARKGIEQGNSVAKKVTSLFTLTSLNYHCLYEACTQIIDLVEEFHITPVSPVRPEIMCTETSAPQMQLCWSDIAKLQSIYPGKIAVRMYCLEDIIKVAQINPVRFMESFMNPVGVSQGRILINFEGVTFSYFPKSISINETIVVDIDSWYRLPYSIAYTIHELSNGVDRFGNDVSGFSVELLNAKSNLNTLYPYAVSKWWNTFGKKSLIREKELIQCLTNN